MYARNAALAEARWDGSRGIHGVMDAVQRPEWNTVTTECDVDPRVEAVNNWDAPERLAEIAADIGAGMKGDANADPQRGATPGSRRLTTAVLFSDGCLRNTVDRR